MLINKFIVSRASVLGSSLAFAGDWKGEGDLGYNSVAGNSESESLALGVTMGYSQDQWEHIADLTARSASADKKTSTEAYTFEFKSKYNFDADLYAFGALRYQDDRFSAYNFQTSVTGGLGYNVIKNTQTLFSVEGGLGFRTSELKLNEEQTDEAVFFGKAIFNQKLSANTDLSSYISTESGQDNTYVEAEIALRVMMTDALALKLAYLAKHNTEVSPGIEKTDRYTTVSLNYKF
jgi:putative salt-induced outer membrane protein